MAWNENTNFDAFRLLMKCSKPDPAGLSFASGDTEVATARPRPRLSSYFFL
jgi:hypothetical protein